MKKIILVISIIWPILANGQYPSNPDFLWNGGVRLADSVMYDSVTASYNTNFKLLFVDFTLTTDIDTLPIKTKAAIKAFNDTIYLTTINEYKKNYNNADSLYFKKCYQVLDVDSSETSAEGIIRVAYYNTPAADANNYFQAIYPSAPRTVCASGCTYTTPTAAQTAATAGDTVIIFNGQYESWVLSKSLTWVGIGAVKVFGSGSNYLYSSTATELHYELSGFHIDAASASNYAFRIITSNAASTANMNHCILYNELATGIVDDQLVTLQNNVYTGLVRFQAASINAKVYDCLFNKAIAGYGQIQTDALNSVLLDRCKFLYNPSPGTATNITTIGGVGINLKRCNSEGRLFNSTTTTSGSVYLYDHVRKDTGTTGVFIDIDNVDITIDESYIDGGTISSNNGKLKITNSNLFDNKIITTFSTTPDTLLIENVNYISQDSSFCNSTNTIPIIQNSTFYHTHYFRFSITNTLSNNNVLRFNYNDCGYNYNPYPFEYIYINTTDYPYQYAEFIGDSLKTSRHYGSEIDHHLILDFGTSVVFKYNFISGAITGVVVKDLNDVGVTNYIYGNVFYECLNPIYLRTMPKSRVINNSFYNNNYDLDYIVFLDDNTGSGIGVNSDSCEFKNNIVQSATGSVYYFGELADTVGFQSSNNIIYGGVGTAYIDENTTNYNFTTWQGLGFDANSYTTNPNFNSATQLWPKQPSDAIGTGARIDSAYFILLDTTSVHPNSVVLDTASYFPDRGAYQTQSFTEDTITPGVDTKISQWAGKINDAINYVNKTDSIQLGTDSFEQWVPKINDFIQLFEEVENDTIIYGTDNLGTWATKSNSAIKLIEE